MGSTQFAATRGNQEVDQRVRNFVVSSFNALNGANLKNVGLFVKEIGDAVLFIFQHFPDVIRWRAEFDKWLHIYGRQAPYEIRTCIHLGEVYLQGVNPLSIAVSHAFKMEKRVRAGHIVLTGHAYNVAWPTIARAYHGFEDYGDIELDGYPSPVTLHRLIVHDDSDTARIATEALD